MATITWTKSWAGSDDGTILKGTDLQNIQQDISSTLTDVLETSDIGVTVQAYSAAKDYIFWENEAVAYENNAVYIT